MSLEPDGHGGAGFPPSTMHDSTDEWRGFLRTVYYMAGMLWCVGAGDRAVAALHGAVKQVAATRAPRHRHDDPAPPL